MMITYTTINYNIQRKKRTEKKKKEEKKIVYVRSIPRPAECTVFYYDNIGSSAFRIRITSLTFSCSSSRTSSSLLANLSRINVAPR